MRLPIPIATLALAATSFANLVANADFSVWESPNQPTGWTLEDTTKTMVERNPDPARSAPYSARETRMIDSLGNNKGLSQFVAVSPNAPYALAAWCFDEDPLVRGGISINWRKADTTTYISNSGVAYSDSGPTGWQRLAKSDSSPAEAALAEVLLRVYNLSGGTPAGGKIYFDDVEFDTGMEALEEQPGRAITTAELEFRPNPTSGRATITFELARPASVELHLRDLTGRSVADLYAGALGAGQHRSPFTGRNREGARLPAGLYFLVLTDGDNHRTVRKVILEPQTIKLERTPRWN